MGNMGMALAEPEAEPASAAKAILEFCGQEPEKPLLLLGGVYNRQLVTAMDIEVCYSVLAAFLSICALLTAVAPLTHTAMSSSRTMLPHARETRRLCQISRETSRCMPSLRAQCRWTASKWACCER